MSAAVQLPTESGLIEHVRSTTYQITKTTFLPKYEAVTNIVCQYAYCQIIEDLGSWLSRPRSRWWSDSSRFNSPTSGAPRHAKRCFGVAPPVVEMKILACIFGRIFVFSTPGAKAWLRSEARANSVKVSLLVHIFRCGRNVPLPLRP